MLRIFSILIAVWTLLAAPSLCQAGVLLHDCYGSTCGHEATCDSDPCSETVIRASSSGYVLTLQSSMIVTMVEFEVPVDPPLAWGSIAQTDFDNPPSTQFRLPLLI